MTAAWLKRMLRRHPELGAAALAAAAWALLGAHALHPHQPPEPFAASLAGWLTMATAMIFSVLYV